MKGSEQAAQTARRGFPLLSVLFCIFLVLKLCGVIGWSWWWVTAPLWGPFALMGVIGVIAGAIWLVFACIDRIVARKHRREREERERERERVAREREAERAKRANDPNRRSMFNV